MKLNQITSALAQQKVGLLSKQTLLTSALLAFAAPALAAEAPADPATAEPAAEDVERIQISGMRATMSRSLDEKRTNSAVVDAIAAADFGDLPGLSISDVIENITSVSGHRGKGSTSETSIRGMGPFLGYSTFNGRTVTSAGYSRAVNFKKFPSELVNKVVVYKSQQADLVEGGVSGTIELSSLRPIDFGKKKTSVELTGIYNSHTARQHDENGFGNKVTFSTVNQFETENYGSMGYTLGFQRTDSANPEESVLNSSTMYGCGTRFADGTDTPSATGDYDCEDMLNKEGITDADGNTYASNNDIRDSIHEYDPDSVFYTSSSQTYRQMEEEDIRKAVVATWQWIPNDAWDINADMSWSKNKYWEDRHDFVVQSARRNLTDHVIGQDGTLLYREGESRFETQGLYRDEVERYNGYGFNVAHYYDDNWKFELDVAYSRSTRNRTSYKSRMQSADYWNYSLDNRNTRTMELRFLDANGLSSDEAGYDSSTAFDPSTADSWLNPYDARTEREMDDRWDTHKSVKFDVDYLVDGDIISSIKAGVRYSKQHLTNEMDDDVALVNPLYNVDGTANINPDTGEQYDTSDDNRSSEYRLYNDDTMTADEKTTLTERMVDTCFTDWNNDRWMNSEDGEPFEGGKWASFDGKCGFGQLSRVNPDGSFEDYGYWEDSRSSGDDDIREDVMAAYVMFNIDTEMFDMNVTGNAGVRVVKTEIDSRGWRDDYTVNYDEETGAAISLETNGELERVKVENDVTEILPSANITFHLADDLLLRTAAYRSLSRPNLQDMGAGRIISTGTGDDENESIAELISSVDGDNPNLEPIMSWNGDISLEWYPSVDTAISTAIYYKRFEASFDNTILNETITIDGVEVPIEVDTITNGDDASDLWGVELSAQHHFADLPGLLSGLGMKGSYNYADSDFKNEDGAFGTAYDSEGNVSKQGIEGFDAANIWGFSEHVFSGSVYWDYEDFSARVLYKYRSKYYQPNTGAAANRYVMPFEYVDVSMKYKLTSDTSVSFKAMNIFDEAQYMTRGTNKNPTLVSSSGPKYFVSVKHQF
ncbi:TonB-dependent receptor [Neiella marina]|uniref:TonB-dependent receptor n=1 Tax=Neiella holothuriorum TaxID=2870530 RepID=A0ABS7EAQ0_9GAMM|nr:TonB-dependent receptor [Neiella holothuriorum]MBW8189417.1 TonB-dependent receptor [Neiella holothuriorum]